MKEMAWRTIDVGKDTSVHADQILKDLPVDTFTSLNEVLASDFDELSAAASSSPTLI